MDYKVSYRKKDKKVQCVINYKINNTWKQKASQKYTTQKEYKDWIKKTLKDLESTAELEAVEEYKDCTLGELIEVFIEHQKLYKEPNTISNYSNSLKLLKDVYYKNIESVKKLDIQTAFDNAITIGIKTISLSSYLARINIFFKYVKNDLGLISKIPSENIKLPKEKNISTKKSLSDKEINKLFENLANDKYYILYYLALNTGMRFAEILGLTWNDINFKKKTINVNRQWKKLSTGEEGFGVLKSKNSIRFIPISHNVVNTLKTYKENTPTDIFNRVACFKYTSLSRVNLKLRKVVNISIHELRHTYATKLVASNIDFKTVAKILGHEVEQTLKIYSHVTDDMMKKAEETIENIF